MKKNKYVFLDAETDGLYGPVISVAMIVVNERQEEIDSFYASVDLKKTTIESQWVKENVLPIIKDTVVYETETELLEAVWAYLMKYIETSEVIGDVCSPVEAGLLAKCVRMDLQDREFKAPFPLLDLSSMFYAVGIDEDYAKSQIVDDEGMVHNALYDVRIACKCFFKYILRSEDHE